MEAAEAAEVSCLAGTYLAYYFDFVSTLEAALEIASVALTKFFRSPKLFNLSLPLTTRLLKEIKASGLATFPDTLLMELNVWATFLLVTGFEARLLEILVDANYI